MKHEISSRMSGFYKLPPSERMARIRALRVLDAAAEAHLDAGGALSVGVVDRMSENVIATHSLPLSIALNFLVNGRDVLIPMAVEEPSIVAASSNAARMVRQAGGFFGEADPPIMTAQVQLDDVVDAEAAMTKLLEARRRLLAVGDASIPRMVERGGGCRDLDVRVLDAELGVIVIHVYVDVGDAMGANIVDTVAEAIAPIAQEIVGGTIGLRILSNLPMRRRVRVRAEVSAEAVGGEAIADGIARASRFADLDPFRAVTHNKGFMNGLDAAAVALGQDFRAIEAGAHAFAALDGTYRPISRWRRTASGLAGEAELPLAVGIVGGSTQAHAGVRSALQLIGAESAGELAIVLASAGLAANLAALRALASEGIQRGHMRLHARKREIADPPIESGIVARSADAARSTGSSQGGAT